MNQRNKFILLLSIITLIAGTYYFFSTNHSSDLVLVGTVDSNQVVVSSRVAGRIEKLPVDEGTPVKPGDLIAQLDTEELQAAADAAHAAAVTLNDRINEAQATEEQTKGETSSDIPNSQARVAATQAQLKQAMADRDRIQSDTERTLGLERQGIVSKQQADEAGAQLRAAQANVQSLEQQVRSAQEQLNMAIARLHQAHAAASNVAATRGQLAQAQAEAVEAQTRVGYARVIAPVAGVVSVRAAREGEVMQPGEPIVTIIDLSNTWVRASIPETQADKILVGDELRVRLPSGGTISGKVIFKAVEGDFATQRDVGRTKRDIKTVSLKLQVANPDGALVPGMTAEVLIPQSKLTNTERASTKQTP